MNQGRGNCKPPQSQLCPGPPCHPKPQELTKPQPRNQHNNPQCLENETFEIPTIGGPDDECRNFQMFGCLVLKLVAAPQALDGKKGERNLGALLLIVPSFFICDHRCRHCSSSSLSS